jgi:hypothetical protein
MAYELIDVEKPRKRIPGYPLLPRKSRESLHKGDHAKLAFQMPGGVFRELIWVRIDVAFAHGEGYNGTTDNTPMMTDSPANGTRIAFGPEHVMVIRSAREHSAIKQRRRELT